MIGDQRRMGARAAGMRKSRKKIWKKKKKKEIKRGKASKIPFCWIMVWTVNRKNPRLGGRKGCLLADALHIGYFYVCTSLIIIKLRSKNANYKKKRWRWGRRGSREWGFGVLFPLVTDASQLLHNFFPTSKDPIPNSGERPANRMGRFGPSICSLLKINAARQASRSNLFDILTFQICTSCNPLSVLVNIFPQLKAACVIARARPSKRLRL